MRLLICVVLALLVALSGTGGALTEEYRAEPQEYLVECYGTYLTIPFDEFALLTGNGPGVLRFYSPYFPAGLRNLVVVNDGPPREQFVEEVVRRWAVEAEAFVRRHQRGDFLENWGAPPWQELLAENGGPRVETRVWDRRDGVRTCRCWRAELVDFEPAPLPGWVNRLSGVVSGRARYTLRVYSPGYYPAD